MTDSKYQGKKARKHMKRGYHGRFAPKDTASAQLPLTDKPAPAMTKDEGMFFNFGGGYRFVRAGPYRDIRPHEVGVKMAVEIDQPFDIQVPIKDFSTPELVDLHRAVLEVALKVDAGLNVYIGCMGGSGRTGLMLGCLSKVSLDLWELGDDPVVCVRQHYRGHAIETAAQEAMVRSFDTRGIVKVLNSIFALRTDPLLEPVPTSMGFVPGYSETALPDTAPVSPPTVDVGFEWYYAAMEYVQRLGGFRGKLLRWLLTAQVRRK